MRKLLAPLVISLVGISSAAQAETVTIAALGDSLTQGYGLVPDQGLVPQLEAWLHDHGADVTLINAGVSGDTTSGGLSRVAWTLTPEVDAMIVTLGANDMLRAIDPAVTRQNMDRILAAGQAHDVDLMVIGMKAPNNYGPEYKRDFDAIYPELSAQYDAIYVESLLAPLSEALNGGAALGDYLQSDGLHPSAKGVARIVKAIGPRVLELVEQAQ